MYWARKGKFLALFMTLCAAISACGNGELASAEPEKVKPTYDCSVKLNSSIEELICKDSALAALDQKMAEVFKAASQTEKAAQDKYFKARQRGWIKGRNECWKEQDKPLCVAESYQRRMLELQMHYGLASVTVEATYLCDGAEVTVAYFDTDPPAALARYKDQESILTISRTASGSKYVGPGMSIWEHQGEAKVVWGYGTTEMHCKVRS
ncbi:MliC family protein [Microbulbifer sp. CAU 1566]|uniref:MliC family protein n=1 Tax=Microbulbifer sp. CAU 1566 TaxID=2933269 RepID=UPI002003C788|nr:MliC family protein [Microbulbifer sp. CAU 1566]MCK7596971.1 MliC family protein [Microbulbifer sp. CAU 1566]